MNVLDRYKPVWAPEGVAGGSSAPSSSSGGSGAPASSGTSAPSSAPSSPSGDSAHQGATTPAGSPASPGEAQPNTDFSGDFSFETIFGDSPEGTGAPSEAPVAPPAAPPAVPTQPVAPPAVAAPAAETPTAPGSVPVEAAAAQVAPGASPPPASDTQIDPYNPGQLAQHLLSVEADATNFVAQQMFQLSPEDKEAIETDVIGHIPKLLARVFVKSQQNVLQQLDRIIPTMVQRHTDAMRRNNEGEDKFYARWPNIGREHRDVVNNFAVSYRKMHPGASLEQMIEDIGPFVMMAARIAPPSNGAPAAGQPAQTNGAKGAVSGRPPQPTPFVPAGSGSGPASQPKAQELNPWEAMFVGRD